jgi:phosphoglycerate dehydrogenase-like enzyme
MEIRFRRSIGRLSCALFCASIVGASPAAHSAASDDAATMIAELGLVEADKPVREMPGWRVPKKIIVADEGIRVADLQPIAPGAKFITTHDPAADWADADVLIGMCTAASVSKAKQVRWIQSLLAGVDACLAVPAVKERGVLITSMQRLQSSVIAEHGIALTMALFRNLGTHISNQRQGKWVVDAAGSDMRSLSGKTMLVVGLGGNGAEVAKRAHALGMKVIATRATGKTGPDYVSYVGLPDEMLSLAKQADVIVNTAPLTAETTKLFDAKFFAVLKPSAYFVNIGRGKSVVTDALVAALNEHRLAGAAVDVLEPEPLPPDHPLWRMTNVIITPHVAYGTDQLPDKLSIVKENLRRYVAGEKMLSVAMVERGY